MSLFGQTVTLVNRTKRTLKVMFDGKSAELTPGENPGFPQIAVEFAKAQNPLMGSGHPYDPTDFKTLVGVKGQDDCSPLDNDPDEVERVNRSKVFGKYSKANTQRVEAGGVSVFESRAGLGGTTSRAEFGRDA